MDKTLSYSFRQRMPLFSDLVYAGESTFGEEPVAQRLTISLANPALVVCGQRLDPIAKLDCQQMENSDGEFRTAVPLRWPLDLENVLDAGFLFGALPQVGCGKKALGHGCSAS